MTTKLVQFRKGLGLTIIEMAERIGVSPSYYEKIEYGDRNPSFNFITLFKKAFPDANTDDIFFNHQQHESCRKTIAISN